MIKVGTRASDLALRQTQMAIAALVKQASYQQDDFKICRIVTTGDKNQQRPISEIGGKDVFVKELDQALLAGEVDFAVHSLKDVPSKLNKDIELVAMLPRASCTDVMILSDRNRDLTNLPIGGAIGIAGPRRIVQLKHHFPQLISATIRGNIDTRVKKLQAGQYDGIILAKAGLERMGMKMGIELDLASFIPAPGQGAIALAVHQDNSEMKKLLSKINHQPTFQAVTLERSLSLQLGGDCQTPLAAYASRVDDLWRLQVMLARDVDSTPVYEDVAASTHQSLLEKIPNFTQYIIEKSGFEPVF